MIDIMKSRGGYYSEYSIFITRALKYIDDTANKVGLNEEDKIKVLERVVERIKDIGKVNG